MVISSETKSKGFQKVVFLKILIRKQIFVILKIELVILLRNLLISNGKLEFYTKTTLGHFHLTRVDTIFSDNLFKEYFHSTRLLVFS